MSRSFALFLAVGFSATAAFLALREAAPGVRNPSVSSVAHGAAPAAPCAAAPPRPLAWADPLPRRRAPRISPRRYEGPSETLVLEVVREDGRPLGGTQVVVPFEAGSQSAIAGLDGRAAFAASPGEVRLVTASRSDFMPEIHDVALDAGTRRFVVPTRTRVEGRVTVGERPPTEPIRIGLSRLHESDSLFTHSDAEGRVEFFNLPSDFRGCFSYPSDYWRDYAGVFPPPGDWEVGLSGTGSGLWPLVEAIDAPNEIRLYRTREIAVFVRDRDGKPLARANVSAPIGKDSTTYSWTGDDGRVPLRVPWNAGGSWLSESIRVGPGTGWPQDRVETVSIIIDLVGHETATVRVLRP